MKSIFTLLVALTATISVFATARSESQLPLYIVNGEAMSVDMVQDINATEIESMTVLRGEEQVADYKHLGDTSNGVVVITLKDREDETPMLVPEVMPSFMGGDLISFRSWVMQNLRYPEEAIEKNLQDIVVVQFVVNREGYIVYDELNILQSKYPEVFVEEVKRLLATSPRWTPGSQKGRAVPVMFTLPITFQISADKGESVVTATSPKYIVDGVPVDNIVIENFTPVSGSYERKPMLYIRDGVRVSSEELWNSPAGEYKQVILYTEGPELEYYKHFGDVSNGVMVFHTVTPEVEPNPDVEPSFMNSSWDGFMQWIYQNIRFPSELKDENISARVIAKFVINDKGYIEVPDIATVTGTPHPLIHNEVRRVLLSSPQWKPATKDGKAVAFSVTLPIAFGSGE